MLPLEGIRVVDFTLVLAGPYSTMMLADMGAEVIRVESLHFFPNNTRGVLARPDRAFVERGAFYSKGYPNQDPGARPWNRYASFNAHSRNKLSMTVDIRQPRGKEIVKRLVARSDVLIENNSSGVMDRQGLGYDVLKAVKPDLVFLSSNGMGNSGPYQHFHGFGSHFEAMVGHTGIMGYPDSDPSKAPNSVLSDAVAGAAIAFAVTAALIHRERTGQGQYIDMAQAETLLHVFAPALLEYQLTGRNPTSTGNRDPAHVPQGVYRCRGEDRWIAISVDSDAAFAGLCRALGNPEWAVDPRFATVAGRWTYHDELDALITALTCQRDHYELFHALQREGVAAGPVLDEAAALADPHMAARGFFEELPHPEAGTYRYPGPLWKLSATPAHLRRHAPLLGEHNEYVYRELLGVSQAEYDELVREGHIGMEYSDAIR